MSVDWEKYSTAEDCRLRARVPEDNGVVSLVAGEVRAVGELDVLHRPEERNRSHSEIRGIPAKNPEKTKVRLRLFKQALRRGWEIGL